jgi:hypothetical protein
MCCALHTATAAGCACRYPLTGERCKFRRRDQRRGGHLGYVELTSEGIKFHARWGAPLAGVCTETFRLVSHTELHIETDMKVGGQGCVYTQIYTRK